MTLTRLKSSYNTNWSNSLVVFWNLQSTISIKSRILCSEVRLEPLSKAEKDLLTVVSTRVSIHLCWLGRQRINHL